MNTGQAGPETAAGEVQAANHSASTERRRRLRGVLESLWSGLSTKASGNLVTAALHLPLPDGPVLLGGDSEGMPHLLLPVSAAHGRQTLLRTQGLSLDVRPLVVGDRPQMFVDLVCRRPGLVRVFLSLATEICSELAADPGDPLNITRRVVTDWRALFGAGFTTWTPARTAGTFAEVIVLRRLLERHSGAAQAWTGPSGAAQDFRAAGRALEVKSTLDPDRRLITVHGWDQLEPPENGTLHLAWFRLEEAQEGLSLREALAEAVDLSGTDRTLMDLVAGLKLPEPPDPEVDGRQFSVREELLLLVDERFPKIVPAAFVGRAVPTGVIDLQYTVDLDTVPPSGQVDDFAHVLDALAVSA